EEEAPPELVEEVPPVARDPSGSEPAPPGVELSLEPVSPEPHGGPFDPMSMTGGCSSSFESLHPTSRVSRIATLGCFIVVPRSCGTHSSCQKHGHLPSYFG